MLVLEEKDLQVEKYQTKQKRKLIEEDRLKEEQRIKALSKDDTGMRAYLLFIQTEADDEQYLGGEERKYTKQ